MSSSKGTTLLPSPFGEASPAKKASSPRWHILRALLVGVSLLVCLNAAGLAPVPDCLADAFARDDWKTKEQCPQVSAIVPEKNAALWNAFVDTIGTDAFKARAVEWLGGAVRVP